MYYIIYMYKDNCAYWNYIFDDFLFDETLA